MIITLHNVFYFIKVTFSTDSLIITVPLFFFFLLSICLLSVRFSRRHFLTMCSRFFNWLLDCIIKDQLEHVTPFYILPILSFLESILHFEVFKSHEQLLAFFVKISVILLKFILILLLEYNIFY